MTVCIVAACRARGEVSLVMCSDRMVSGSLGSAETLNKIFEVKPGWYCLAAGEKGAIVALKKHFKTHLANVAEINDTNISSTLAAPLAARKRELADEYVQGRLGMSYADFLKTGRTTLPEAQFVRLIGEIERLQLGCQFIICGFGGGAPQICETWEDASLHLYEDYAAIGEGSHLAQSILLQRGQSGSRAIMGTVYRVYESKKMAEHVPSVGERTHLYVLTDSGALTQITDDGYKYLDQLFEKFAPKAIEGMRRDDDYFATATL